MFKSTDRGDSWTTISGDLSRQLDRNTLPIMDRYWGPEAIALHKSTSIYGNIVTLRESPLDAGHLWVGTDDGLVWKSKDDGNSWSSVKTITGLPKTQVGSLNLPLVYVQDLMPSQHDKKVIYAAFNNHKNGDFKPYLFKSIDGGKSWDDIAKDLPERGSVYSIAEDHINPNLLFAGTEFGVFFTLDGGENWAALKSGLPTIAVRDIAIQERENDLVLGTFGRGFYVLDNYSPLRELEYVLEQESAFFTTKPGLLFRRASIGGTAYKGAQLYKAKNPEVGTTFEWYLAEGANRVKENRSEANEELPHYPSLDQLQKEDWEEQPYLIFEVSDSLGNPVARFTKADSKGISRYTWDGRMSSKASIRTNGEPITEAYGTTFVLPGTYYMSLSRSTNGTLETLVARHEFKVNHLYNYEGIDMEFNQSVDALMARSNEVSARYSELNAALNKLRAGLRNTPGASLEDLSTTRTIEMELKELGVLLNGNSTRKKREFETAGSLGEVTGLLAWGTFNHRGAPTGTMRTMKEDAEAMITDAITALEKIADELDQLETKAREQGVPFWD